MTHDSPEHLDPTARAKWAMITPILQERGGIDQGTLDALAAYCVAWSRWAQAEAQVNALGPVVKSPAGFAIVSPYVAVAAAAQRQMRQWGAELKLTPKARGTRSTRKATEPASPEADGNGGGGGLLRLLATERPPTAKRRRNKTG